MSELNIVKELRVIQNAGKYPQKVCGAVMRAANSIEYQSKLIKDDEWISVDENNNYPDPGKHKLILGIDMKDSEPYVFECEWDGDTWSNIGGESFTHWKPSDRPK